MHTYGVRSNAQPACDLHEHQIIAHCRQSYPAYTSPPFTQKPAHRLPGSSSDTVGVCNSQMGQLPSTGQVGQALLAKDNRKRTQRRIFWALCID